MARLGRHASSALSTVVPSARGWWFQEALRAAPIEPAPPLEGEASADVVIIGGGYTGMWTASHLLEAEPEIGIVLLERDVCGGGPSGRNGGFVSGWWDELSTLVALFGTEGALAACRALGSSVAEIGAWCRRHEVDAWFRHQGQLQVASSPGQEGAWRESTALAARLGVGEEFVELTPGEVRERCGSPAFGGGALMRDGATVQPARLAMGLRRVLLERGVRIHEHSRVRSLEGGARVRAVTQTGTVRAEQAVLAVNAWAARWPGLRRSLVNWGSHIVLTAPAPDRLADLGWTAGESIADSRSAVHYFRTTPDGRVAFGGGGGRASWLGRIGPEVDQDPASIARAAEGLRRLLPSFSDVPLEAAWGGPIDVSPTHLPFFDSMGPGNVHVGAGYSGNGVAPSHLGGRILAGLARGVRDEVTTLPLVGGRRTKFPPEPVRSIGAHIVRQAVIRFERAQDRGRRVGPVVSLVAHLPRKMGYHLGPE
jgi:glycine/D-amino acid oxidase-like deaminating enzyme